MTNLLDSARTFIVSNARLLERQRLAYLFAEGSRQQVLAALLGYQNPDGGFGNALEPDKRTGTSQPIDQELALSFLDEIGGEREVALRICDFLETITTAEGGVPFVLPTVRDAPGAPWWNTESDDPPATINPTASIAGLLYKQGIEHRWLNHATTFCWRQIEEGELAGHDFFCALLFLEHVPDRQRAEQAFERISRQCSTAARLPLIRRLAATSSCRSTSRQRRAASGGDSSTMRRSRLISMRWRASSGPTVAGRSRGRLSAPAASLSIAGLSL